MKQISHHYGPNVHILDDLMATSGLARLSNSKTGQHEVRGLTGALYREVLLRAVINLIFPTSSVGVMTPMAKFVDKRGMLLAEVINPTTKVAIATLLRAGEVPASVCFNRLSGILDPDTVRQDFFGAGRITNDAHQVTGTDVTYMKIGDLQDRVLLIPDPMGATGGTVVKTLSLYSADQVSVARAIVAMHLIITPEYIKRVHAEHPQAKIFALRLDRGMSDQEVLESVPGTFPDRERGLTDNHYIVPGAGDLGYRLTGAI